MALAAHDVDELGERALWGAGARHVGGNTGRGAKAHGGAGRGGSAHTGEGITRDGLRHGDGRGGVGNVGRKGIGHGERVGSGGTGRRLLGHGGGALLLIAGLMLLLPGFITDALGFLLLIPPLRRRLILRFVRAVPVHPRPGQGPGPRVIEGEFRRERDR